MSAKEKSWILANISCLRLRPRPWLAMEELFELGAGARDLCVLAYRAAAERRGGGDWRTGPVMV